MTARTAPARTGAARAADGATNSTATAPRALRPAGAPAAKASSPSTHSATAAASASTAPAPARPSLSTTGINRTVIVLDPGHGGVDSGSRIGDNTVEKTVTLAFAFRLRALLIARGFTVVMTRESDGVNVPNAAATPLTLDDRAGIANHSRAAACLLLHATGRGNGVHLYTSELDAAPGEAAAPPWLTAQAAWIPASQQLASSLSIALGRSQVALVSSTASVRPVDSLTCPAVVLELAPESEDVLSINDANYQERVAAALAGALVFWQNRVQPPPRLAMPSATPHTTRHHTGTAPASPGEVRP